MSVSRTETTDLSALFDQAGQRKYLAGDEGRRFLEAAQNAGASTHALCRLLAFTGCRISEALALTPRHIDPPTGRVIYRTLKRRRLVYRAVPIPASLMADLLHLASGLPDDARLWGCCRQTAWRRIKQVMACAGIAGPHAVPKGLRHQFGIRAAERGIPIGLTGRWMGHANLRTTAIYQNAMGEEEHRLAQRLWTDPA